MGSVWKIELEIMCLTSEIKKIQIKSALDVTIILDISILDIGSANSPLHFLRACTDMQPFRLINCWLNKMVDLNNNITITSRPGHCIVSRPPINNVVAPINSDPKAGRDKRRMDVYRWFSSSVGRSCGHFSLTPPPPPEFRGWMTWNKKPLKLFLMP